jgi:hypothetical protein
MYHTCTILLCGLFWPLFHHSPRFPLIMVVSGFGPYHRQQPDDTPAECAGITPTPWAIMPTLGFVSYCWGHELLVTPPTQRICRFCFLGEKILHETMVNMHLYYELPLLIPLLTPPNPPPIPGHVRQCLIAGIHGLGHHHCQHATT